MEIRGEYLIVDDTRAFRPVICQLIQPEDV